MSNDDKVYFAAMGVLGLCAIAIILLLITLMIGALR